MNQLKALFLFILLACSLNITAQRIKGSDTVLPVSQETAEIFMKDDPDRRVTVTGGGTGVGISALMDNTTDIAMASRPIKFSEKMKLKAAKQEVEEVIIAYDALAVIVNPSNPVSQLTRQQLEAIFRGKITNWKQLGGPDMKIIVYSRETSSGVAISPRTICEIAANAAISAGSHSFSRILAAAAERAAANLRSSISPAASLSDTSENMPEIFPVFSCEVRA